MLLSISESLGEISLNLIKVMNRKENINLVFLKSFDLLFDLYLLCQLEAPRIHDQVIVELTNHIVDQLVGLDALLKTAFGVPSRARHVLHLHHWSNQLLGVWSILLLFAPEKSLKCLLRLLCFLELEVHVSYLLMELLHKHMMVVAIEVFNVIFHCLFKLFYSLDRLALSE